MVAGYIPDAGLIMDSSGDLYGTSVGSNVGYGPFSRYYRTRPRSMGPARRHYLRHAPLEHATRRQRDRFRHRGSGGRHLRLHAGGRDDSALRRANFERDLHADRHGRLQSHHHLYGALGQSGHTGADLEHPRPHYLRHGPLQHATGCHSRRSHFGIGGERHLCLHARDRDDSRPWQYYLESDLYTRGLDRLHHGQCKCDAGCRPILFHFQPGVIQRCQRGQPHCRAAHG